jgi:hypothetical protein
MVGILMTRPAGAGPLAFWDGDHRILVTGSLLGLALLLGALVIAAVGRWRRRDSSGLSPSAELSRYRSLYEKGEISQEEFERLRDLLGGQIRRSVNVSQGKALAGGGPSAPQPAAGPQDGFPPPTPPEAPEHGIRPG